MLNSEIVLIDHKHLCGKRLYINVVLVNNLDKGFIHINFRDCSDILFHAMVRMGIRGSPTAGLRSRAQAIPCEIFYDARDIGTTFLLTFSPPRVIPPLLHTRIPFVYLRRYVISGTILYLTCLLQPSSRAVSSSWHIRKSG